MEVVRVRSSRTASAALALVAIAFPGAALAKTLVLPALRDATLIESADGSLANGSGPYFFAGRTGQTSGSIRRALLAFDVAAQVPPGAKVTAARLTLQMSQSNAGAVGVSLHRVLTDWGEGASSASG